ncbi:MAG: hypothetical protein MSIBF_05645 [Candidatus Altiarchaeales archaeon IMC4]|nr:MAG: hypothetical protein MSIBF_05645 [Candidatus Altiarchaeales archaeon IMC4]
MSKTISELYGVDIYTQKGVYIGKVQEVILNLDKGEIMQLSLQPFRSNTVSTEEVKRILQSECVNYADVTEVGDIIICQKEPKPPKKKRQ